LDTVLITGGSGGVGRYVAAELEDKYQVTLFDRMTPDKVRHPWETELPFVLGDLTSSEDCMRAISFARAEAIVHLGAIPYPTELVHRRPGMMLPPLPEDETMRVNTMGTFYLMDAARRLGVKRVVMASTYFVLGLGNRISGTPFRVEYLPIDEDHPLRPEDSYSLSKVLGEEILAAFSRAYGLVTIALRLMGVVYPHWMPPWYHPNIKPEHRKGGGFGTFEYVDARDVALACRLALEAEGLSGFEAVFISTDTVLAEDTRVVVERCYPHLKEMAVDLHGKEGITSIEKARELLGYVPQHPWRSAEG